MTKTKRMQTDRFTAAGPSGRQYIIIETTTMIGFTPLDTGRTEWTPGAREYNTADGGPVNPNDDGTFDILDTDERVSRI